MNHPTTRFAIAALTLALLAPAVLAADEQPAQLQPGEYDCISGITGQPVSLGVVLAADQTYTDLHGRSPGTYVINGTGITFADGAMDGYVGEIGPANAFKVGLMASCTLKGG